MKRPSTFTKRGLRIYACLLAAVSILAFVTGGAVNYFYAKRNPGADPYAARTVPQDPMLTR